MKAIGWRSLALNVVIVLIAVASLWIGWLTGGIGLSFVIFGVTAASWLTLRERRRITRVRWCAVAIVVTVGVWNSVSLTSYAMRDNGESLTSRVATWGRDHRLGAVVDRLESWRYSTPPSAEPATRLELTVTTTSSPSSGSTTVVSTVTTIPVETSTTQPPGPRPPADLAPLFSPALPGEGRWVSIARAGGFDAMWATSMRPLASAGGVVATMVVIDQTHLRSVMFNGSEEPGGGGWANGNRVPIEMQSALRATMNGGFRFDHIKGGYVNEGRTVKALRDGDATIAIDADGVVSMGRLGRDVMDDGHWVSLRQNLELIVDDGESRVREGIANGVWWGADYGNEVYVKRSGLCVIDDGRLAYVMADQVDAEQFAQSMIAMGCTRAMQLDINEDWPSFSVYRVDSGEVVPQFVDGRMSGNPRRYLDGSTKEFFAFFER